MKAAVLALALLALPVGGCASLQSAAPVVRLDTGKLIADADVAVIGIAKALTTAAPALPVAIRQEAEDDLDNLNALLRNAHDLYAKGDSASAADDIAAFNTGLATLKNLIGSH